jgi:hypothetical protein
MTPSSPRAIGAAPVTLCNSVDDAARHKTVVTLGTEGVIPNPQPH